MAASTWKSLITELAFRRTNRARSSRSFIVRAIHWCITPKEVGLGYRWCATSWRPTAVKLAWKARRAKAVNSPSHFRYKILQFSRHKRRQHESGGASEVQCRASDGQDSGGRRRAEHGRRAA